MFVSMQRARGRKRGPRFWEPCDNSVGGWGDRDVCMKRWARNCDHMGGDGGEGRFVSPAEAAAVGHMYVCGLKGAGAGAGGPRNLPSEAVLVCSTAA